MKFEEVEASSAALAPLGNVRLLWR